MLLRMGGRGRVYNICYLCGELAYVGGTACSLIYDCCWHMGNGGSTRRNVGKKSSTITDEFQLGSLLVYRLVHAPVIAIYIRMRAKAGFDSQTESEKKGLFFLQNLVCEVFFVQQ